MRREFLRTYGEHARRLDFIEYMITGDPRYATIKHDARRILFAARVKGFKLLISSGVK